MAGGTCTGQVRGSATDRDGRFLADREDAAKEGVAGCVGVAVCGGGASAVVTRVLVLAAAGRVDVGGGAAAAAGRGAAALAVDWLVTCAAYGIVTRV